MKSVDRCAGKLKNQLNCLENIELPTYFSQDVAKCIDKSLKARVLEYYRCKEIPDNSGQVSVVTDSAGVGVYQAEEMAVYTTEPHKLKKCIEAFFKEFEKVFESAEKGKSQRIYIETYPTVDVRLIELDRPLTAYRRIAPAYVVLARLVSVPASFRELESNTESAQTPRI